MSTVPYLYPTSTKNVSDSFLDHVARGSVNPGTDYTAPYGSRVQAVADGYVSDIVTTNYGSGGRMVYIDHDDGLGTDYLHLSLIAPGIKKGARVFRGDKIGDSGASGYGEEWYYGAHLHISIRNTHGWHAENHGNFDFDQFLRNQAATLGDGSTPITPAPPAPPKAEEMYLYVQRQGTLTTYILYIPARNTYQTTQDTTTANQWAVLVGHDAWPIQSEHVLALDGIRRQFA